MGEHRCPVVNGVGRTADVDVTPSRVARVSGTAVQINGRCRRRPGTGQRDGLLPTASPGVSSLVACPRIGGAKRCDAEEVSQLSVGGGARIINDEPGPTSESAG